MDLCPPPYEFRLTRSKVAAQATHAHAATTVRTCAAAGCPPPVRTRLPYKIGAAALTSPCCDCLCAQMGGSGPVLRGTDNSAAFRMVLQKWTRAQADSRHKGGRWAPVWVPQLGRCWFGEQRGWTCDVRVGAHVGRQGQGAGGACGLRPPLNLRALGVGKGSPWQQGIHRPPARLPLKQNRKSPRTRAPGTSRAGSGLRAGSRAPSSARAVQGTSPAKHAAQTALHHLFLLAYWMLQWERASHHNNQ